MKRQINKLLLARGRYLEKRPVSSIIACIGKLSLRWLNKDYPFRKKAVRQLVEKSRFTERMAEELLDALFRELTRGKLLKLLKAELGDLRVLDEFRHDVLNGRWQRARGPRVITHIFSRNVPNPAIVSFILGMLVKSVNIGKVSSEDEGFLNIYLASLKSFDKRLAATNYVLNSRVGAVREPPLRDCIQRSNLVVAYGDNESLEKIRDQVPVTTPFVGYGHRVSFGIYTKEVLNKRSLVALVKKTAHDIWMADQRGCLSPVEIFIEAGGEVPFAEFSGALMKTMERLFAAKAWRLPDRLGEKHTLGFRGRKMISARLVKNLERISEILKPFEKYLQAVSLEAGSERRQKIADRLSALGVNRICRAGQMQRPPVTWHHDGKFNLASWVNWTDLEI